MKIKVHFNTWPATGSFDGYIKAEGNNCYAQAYVCGESVRGDSEDSPIHQRPFNLLERMLLLKNILILLRS